MKKVLDSWTWFIVKFVKKKKNFLDDVEDIKLKEPTIRVLGQNDAEIMFREAYGEGYRNVRREARIYSEKLKKKRREHQDALNDTIERNDGSRRMIAKYTSRELILV